MKFSEIKIRLKEKKVGIAGAGGLGSNAAMALVRVGLGHLLIADFDVVEESNLNRQFYFWHQVGMKKADAIFANLLKINPDLDIQSLNIKLNPGNIKATFEGCHLLIEAFDQADQKQMFIETVLAEMPGVPIVAGNGMAGVGGFESIKIFRDGKLFICGGGVSEISPQVVPGKNAPGAPPPPRAPPPAPPPITPPSAPHSDYLPPPDSPPRNTHHQSLLDLSRICR